MDLPDEPGREVSADTAAPPVSDDRDVAATVDQDSDARSRVDNLQQAISKYAQDGSSRDEVGDAVQRLVAPDIRNARAYVAKLTGEGRRNQFWQGRGNTEPHDVLIFVDQAGDLDATVSLAKSRLGPRSDSGFSAVVVMARVSDTAPWLPYAIVEYEGSTHGDRAKKAWGVPNLRHLRISEPQTVVVDMELEDRLLVGAKEGIVSVEELIVHLQEAKNVILFGPPGTGKTHLALEVVKKLGGEPIDATRLSSILAGDRIENHVAEITDPPLVWELVQFHASYSYEDFVRGVRTDPDANGFSLTVVDGVLPLVAEAAAMRGTRPTILIIDEINRADLSAVLGESVFALDPGHRGRAVRLQHAASSHQNMLRIPPNLWLVGTMNSADRSIAVMDLAIRRRFRFVPVRPSRQIVIDSYAHDATRAAAAAELYDLFADAVTDVELKPGHSYFIVAGSSMLKPERWAERLTDQIVFGVRPLLREYRQEGVPLGRIELPLESEVADLLDAHDAHVFTVLKDWLVKRVVAR